MMSMIHTSTMEWFTSYTPMTQNMIISGYRYAYGMRSRFTNNPTSGRLSASSIRLPTYIEATKPQNTVGWSFTSVGPGGTPWMSSAAISTAITGPVGMPSASIGTNAPVDAALLAASGPATPATAPLPNSSGVFEMRFSSAYDMKLEMMCAEPGMMPMTKPSSEPRPIGATACRHSVRLGHSSLNLGLMTCEGTWRLGVDRISPSPNRPTATGTIPMPSPSSAMLKE